MVRLIAALGRYRPDTVHNVALKPVLYGSFAARVTGVARVVNALGGLGYVLSSSTLKARLMRRLTRPALKLALSII